MLMQFSKTAAIADRIARHARRLGYSVDADKSGLSASRYVMCRPDETRAFKVRVSDHDPKPTYADGAIDVDTDTGRAMGCHWAAAVARLAREIGKPVPPTAARALAKIEAARRAADAETRARGLALQAAEAARATGDLAVAAAFPAEWAAALAMTGADRREAKRLLRRRHEAGSAA